MGGEKKKKIGGWDYFSDHYPSQDGKEEVLVRPPVMSPPPVLNLWNLYGINVKTEIAYYYKETDHGLHLDERADSFKFVFFLFLFLFLFLF